jgi:asparagine N-glycosylation enzyme membrane subunit Stt3
LIHEILISIHAIGGIACFIAGLIVLVPPTGKRSSRRRFFNLFLGSLFLMLIALYLVIVYDWPRLDTSQQVIFTFLGILGLYMAFRASNTPSIEHKIKDGAPNTLATSVLT